MIHCSTPRETREEPRIGGARFALKSAVGRCNEAERCSRGFGAGKMHLWRSDFVEKNSMFGSPRRRKNFLFAAMLPDIYRK
jgi:hypothetical protein